MAATQAFLKETVLNSKNPKPGIVKVVRHVDGPLEDGSLVREVADREVYIKAIFTRQSQDTYQQSYEDSYNSQPDWGHALLLLNQYRVECQPSFAVGNREKRPCFVLVVERFGLCNIHEGFYSKNQLQDIMADQEVQAKAYDVEKLLCSTTAQGMDRGSENVDLSLSQLLDQLGESSLPDTTMTSLSQNVQQKQNDDPCIHAGDGLKYTLQSALEAMRNLSVDNFIVSSDQQALLDVIPEWKADYTAPAAESMPEQLTCDPSSPLSSDPPDFAQQGPTLRSERGPALPSTPPLSSHSTAAKPDGSTKTATPASATGEAGQNSTGRQEPSKAVKGNQPEGGSATVLTPSHDDLPVRVVTIEDSSDAEEDAELGKRTTVDKEGDIFSAPAHDGAAGDCAADASVASETSLDSLPHHPDVSFSISSPSNQEEIVISDDSSPPPVISAPDAAHNTSMCNQTSKSNKGPHVSVTDGSESQRTGCQRQRGTDIPCHSNQVAGKSEVDLSSATLTGSSNPQAVSSSADSACNKTDAQAVVHREIGSRAAPCSDPNNPRSSTTDVGRSSTAAKAAMPCTGSSTGRDSDSGVEVDQPSACRNTEGQGSSLRNRCSVDGIVAGREGNQRSLLESVSPGASPRHSTAEVEGQPASQLPCCTELPEPTFQLAAEKNTDTDSQLPCTMEFTVQASQGFKPLNMLTEDLVPDSSYFEAHQNLVGTDDREVAEQHGEDGDCVITLERSTRLQQNGSPGGLRRRSSPGGRGETGQEQGQAGKSRAQGDDPKASDNQSTAFSADQTESSPEHLVQHSTQNVSAGDSQSQPLILSLSPIQHHTNHPDKRLHASVLEMDKEEHARLKALEGNISEAEPSQSNQPSVKSQEAPAATDPEMKNFPEGAGAIHQTVEECTNTSRVLVHYSGSDDTDESCGNKPTQDAGERLKTSHTEVQTISSGETVVVPDSSQEDVIVVSSSNSSSMGDVNDKQLESEVHTVGELYGLTKSTSLSRKVSAHPTSRNISEAAHKSGQTDKTKSPELTSEKGPVNTSRLIIDLAVRNSDLCQDPQNRKRKSTSSLLERSEKRKRDSGQTSNTRLEGSKESTQVQKHHQSISEVSVNTDVSRKGSNNDGPLHSTVTTAESDMSEEEANALKRMSSKTRRDSRSPQDVECDMSEEEATAFKRIPSRTKRDRRPQNVECDMSEEEATAFKRISSRTKRDRRPQDVDALPPRKQLEQRRVPATSSRTSRDPVIHRGESPGHNMMSVSQLDSALCSRRGSDTNPNHNATEEARSVRKDAGLKQTPVSRPTRQKQTTLSSQLTLERIREEKLQKKTDRSRSVSNQARTSSHQTETSENDGWLCSSRLQPSKQQSLGLAPPHPWQAERGQRERDRPHSGSTRCGQSAEDRTSFQKSPQRQTTSKEQCLRASPVSKASRNRCRQQLSSTERTDSSSDETEETVSRPSRSRHADSVRAAGDRHATMSRHEGVRSKRTTSSRTADQSITLAAQEECSETNSSHREADMNNVHGSIRRNLGAWLEYRARSEDPQQHRLRRLKLAVELLDKVEECLCKPCT